jgi:hypothetical protein
MSKIFNDLIQEQKSEEIKIIPDGKIEIMNRYLQFRKLAISYWDIFTFSLGYCIIFPIIHKIQERNRISIFNFSVASSFFFAYFFYKHNLKHFIRIFNKKDLDNFEIFCKKYNLEDEILL